MDKLTKFAKLDEMGITRAEMEEYFKAKEPQTPQVNAKHIKTPLPLIYKSVADNDCHLCLEYGLDPQRKDAVWGIAVDGVWVKLKNEPSNDLRKARAYCKKNTECGYGYKCIPNDERMLEICRQAEAFNQTVEILQANGIDADPLAGEYMVEAGWCWYNKRVVDVDSQTRRYVKTLKPDMHIRLIHSTETDYTT